MSPSSASHPESIDRIGDDAGLDRLVRSLASHPFVAFDTEFVSEHTYRSQLCLLQVAAPGILAAVDTLAVPDLTPFWKLLAEPGRTTIVHAGREELGFAFHAGAGLPSHLFDVQIAAGLVDHEYPAGYAALVRRLLGKGTNKAETRTDWRRRPLSEAQITYAMDDVRHLEDLWRLLERRLAELGRTTWMTSEMSAWQADVCGSFQRKRWQRVAGLNSLSRRELALARELWHWRDGVAEERDMPPKRVLRDDLLVELAKRRNPDEREIRAIRGMQRSDLKHILPDLSAAIERGLSVADEDLPGGERHRSAPAGLNMLGQFLATAIAGYCRQESIAPALVGTASDMRDLLAHKLGHLDEPPLLTHGWRAELVGGVVDDLLAGRAALRIGDINSNDPLVIERFG